MLVVEDEPDTQELLELLLPHHGHAVVTAPNGCIALDQIALGYPDVILTDITMPGMDGVELCSRLKADSTTRVIPIVVMSVLQTVPLSIRAFACRYLRKPLDFASLAQVISQCMQQQ